MKDKSFPEIAEYIIEKTKKTNPGDILRDIRESKDFLECLTNRATSRIMYAIYLVKVSNPYELRGLLNFTSHTIVEHRLVNLINGGIVAPITINHEKRGVYHNCWNTIHPNTHNRVTLYAITPQGEALNQVFSDRLSLLLGDSDKKRLETRGKLFNDIFERLSKHEAKKERERISSVVDVFGSCSRCQKIIRHSDFDNGKAEEINGEVCCSACILQMYNTGELKARRMSE